MPHNNSTSEQTNNARQSQQLTHQIGKIPIQQNQTSLLNRMPVERFQLLKQIT